MTNHLIEHIPENLVVHWRETSVFWVRMLIGAITSLWVPLFTAVAWLPFRNSTEWLQLFAIGVAGITLSLGWCLLVHQVGRIVANSWTEPRLPVVNLNLDDRALTLTWNRQTLNANIDDCVFRIGRPWRMKLLARKRTSRPILFGDRDVILIDFPPAPSAISPFARYTTAAVGYTDESMRLWYAALELPK